MNANKRGGSSVLRKPKLPTGGIHLAVPCIPSGAAGVPRRRSLEMKKVYGCVGNQNLDG